MNKLILFVICFVLTDSLHPTSAKDDCEENPNRLSFDGKCFEFMAEKATWKRAKDICMIRGGKLSAVRSTPQQEFFAKTLGERYPDWDSIWLGAREIITEWTNVRDNTRVRPRPYGCFDDRSNDHDMGDPIPLTEQQRAGLTVDLCSRLCMERNVYYAGLQAGKYCFCKNTYGRYGYTDNCNTPCPGNSSQICGGLLATSIWRITHSFTDWAPGEPNTDYSDYKGCAVNDVNLGWKWRSASCLEKHLTICHFKENTRGFYSPLRNYFEARQFCQTQGFWDKFYVDLVINSRASNDWWVSQLKNESRLISFWTGVTNRKWVDVDDNNLKYLQRWADGQPDHGWETCVQMKKSSGYLWHDTLCDPETANFICEFESGCGRKFRYGEHCFEFMGEKLTYTEAKRKCSSIGANLPIINNKLENDFMGEIMRTRFSDWSHLWLGAKETTMDWRWVRWMREIRPFAYGCFKDDPNDRDLAFKVNIDPKTMSVDRCAAECAETEYFYMAVQNGDQCFCGSKYGKHGAARGSCNVPCQADASQTCGGANANFVYDVGFVWHSFKDQEPDDGGPGGYERCGAMIHNDSHLWSDRPCYEKKGFICQFDDGTRAFTHRQLNWYKAREYCIEQGGDLANVGKAMHNDWVKRFRDSSTTNDFWVGLSRSFWNWEENGYTRSMFYTSWGDNQPNSREQTCAAIAKLQEYKWNDMACDSILNYVCQKKLTKPEYPQEMPPNITTTGLSTTSTFTTTTSMTTSTTTVTPSTTSTTGRATTTVCVCPTKQSVLTRTRIVYVNVTKGTQSRRNVDDANNMQTTTAQSSVSSAQKKQQGQTNVFLVLTIVLTIICLLVITVLLVTILYCRRCRNQEAAKVAAASSTSTVATVGTENRPPSYSMTVAYQKNGDIKSYSPTTNSGARAYASRKADTPAATYNNTGPTESNPAPVTNVGPETRTQSPPVTDLNDVTAAPAPEATVRRNSRPPVAPKPQGLSPKTSTKSDGYLTSL